MLRPLDYFFWVVGFIFEIYIVISAIFRREFFRYFPFNFCMLSAALVVVGQYYCIRKFGFSSANYAYYYYDTESLLTILMLTVIIQLYLEVFREMRVGRYVKGAAMVVAVATGLVSYAIVHHNRSQLTTRFVVELGQNLHFVGVVFTYVLWGAILKLHETRARLVQLILALGVFYSGTAVAYALRNLFPPWEMRLWRWLPPLFGTLLPLAWAYTFTRVPEGARVITSPAMAGER